MPAGEAAWRTLASAPVPSTVGALLAALRQEPAAEAAETAHDGPAARAALPTIRDPATGRRLLDPYGTVEPGEELPF